MLIACLAAEEPIANFGLNSISLVELGAFINAQFNVTTSTLELMTRATALSLAKTIVSATD